MSPTNLKSFVQAACLLEARAKKPGNVHPEASFCDLCYADFVQAAGAVAAVLSRTPPVSLGRSVFDSIQATQATLSRQTNPNLGIVLLLAPLVAVARTVKLRDGIEGVLENLTQEDAELIYAAIRLANPGGMGKVESGDVAEEPVISLREAMRMAANRDSIASEYTTGFQIVLQTGVPFLSEWPNFEQDWEDAILHLQFLLMSHFPDTLIARKCGPEIAAVSATKSREILHLGGMKTEPGRDAVRQFDHWLRADGHRRNPGTTADLIAASLFAAGRDGMINLNLACPDVVSMTNLPNF